MQTYPFAPRTAFLIGGAVSVLAALISYVGLVWPAPPADTGSVVPLDCRRHILSFGTAWCQGFLEGGLAAFLPLYLLALGYSEASVSWLLGGTLLGVILFQVPAGWVADTIGPTGALAACYALAAAGLAWLPFCSAGSTLVALLFVTGACIGAFYPLGLARLGQRLPAAALPKANAWYLAINCLGSLTGPVAAGAAMDYLGRGALFGIGVVALLLVLAACLVVHLYPLREPRAAAATPESSPPLSDCKVA
jgi:MFS family permease